MKRDWYKYINHQKYSECQLITALNAYYYLTGNVYCKIGSKKYEKLVDLVKARYGSAICIEKAHKKLGLVIKEKHRYFYSFKKKLPLPIEINVWHKRTGFHSVLIVEQCEKCNTVRIANFRHVTCSDGWVFKEDLYQWEGKIFAGDDGINSDGKKWNYRSFGLL